MKKRRVKGALLFLSTVATSYQLSTKKNLLRLSFSRTFAIRMKTDFSSIF